MLDSDPEHEILESADRGLRKELQEIAVQLKRDAAQVVDTYPAQAPQSWRRAFAISVQRKLQPQRHSLLGDPSAEDSSHLRRFREFLRPAAAAVIAVAIGGTSWYAAGLPMPGDRVTSSELAQPSAAPNGGRGEVLSAGMLPSALGNMFSPDSATKVHTPADAFYHSTGAQTEALIDAIQENGHREPSVRY